MPSSLITKVAADIRQLELDLAKAEARWRRYEKVAREAASLSVTGAGVRGGAAAAAGGVGVAGSAAARQRSELRQVEENLKASNRRLQAELDAALKQGVEATKAAESAKLQVLKTALAQTLEALRQADRVELEEIRNRNKTEIELRRETRRILDRLNREEGQRVRSQKGEDALFAELRREEQQRAASVTRQTREETAAFLAAQGKRVEGEREANQAGERAFRNAEQAKRREIVKTEQVASAARRATAGDLRQQIRLVTGGFGGFGGTGGGGPPFRPVPTGSRPEDIVALRQHLAEANTAGARLSRTIQRIGQADLRQASQSAHFFANALKLAAGAAIIGGFTQLVKRGIELNREWERFRFGLGTALALTSKVVDAQGNVVTGARAFRVLSADGEKLFRAIREEANKTILTTEELVEVVTTNFSQAIRAGIPEKDIIQLTSRIAQVAKSLGLQGGTPQLVQEVRAILSGDIRRGATVAQVLGLTSKEVQNAREAGTLVKLLTERLAGAQPIVEAFGKSSEAAFTTLISKGQDFLRLTLEDVFKRLTGRVLDINKELSSGAIERFAQRTGRVFTALFQQIEKFVLSGQGQRLADSFSSAFQAIGDFANSGAFTAILGLFKFLVDHHRELLLVFGGIQAFRGLAGASAGLAALGRAGGLLAGTSVGPRIAGGIPGLLGLGGRAAAQGAVGGGLATAAGAALTGGGAVASRAAALRSASLVTRLLGTGARAPAAAIAGGALSLPVLLGLAVGGGLLANAPGVQASLLAQEEAGQAAARGGVIRSGLSPQLAALLGRDVGVRTRGARIEARRARVRAEELLAATRQAAVGLRGRGEEVAPFRQLAVAVPGAEGREIQVSLRQAEERVRIAREAERKLLGVAKEGGDRRVQSERETTKQLLDLERLKTQQRIAELTGDVRRQIELETLLTVAEAQVGKNAIKNEKDRQAFIAAARAEGGRKLRELDFKAALETSRAEAAATDDRARQRQLDLDEEVHQLNEAVRKREITLDQGRRRADAKRAELTRANLEDFRAAQARAVDLTTDFARLTIRAQREQEEARRRLRDFNRQVAREQLDLVRQQVAAERELTNTVRQEARTREDVALRRRTLGLQREEAGAREEIERTLGAFVKPPEERATPVPEVFGPTRNTVEEALASATRAGLPVGTFQRPERGVQEAIAKERIRQISEAVLGSQARTLTDLRDELTKLLQEQGVRDVNVPELARRLFGQVTAARGRRLGRQDVERAQEALGLGREGEEIERRPDLTAREQFELTALRQRQAVGGVVDRARLLELARRQGEAGVAPAEGEAARATAEQRTRLRELLVQESEARERATETLADLRRQVNDTSLDLARDFTNLGKEAQDLLPQLGRFKGGLAAAANALGELTRLTPQAAGARAAALGPQQVNLTVDLRGGLGEGVVTDPIVQSVLDRVLQRLQQDIRRGPVGRP